MIKKLGLRNIQTACHSTRMSTTAQIVRRITSLYNQLDMSGSILHTSDSIISRLLPAADLFQLLRKFQNEIENLEKFQQENIQDKEMAGLAADEIVAIQQEMRYREEEVLNALIPNDEDDCCSAILEVRPGTGGDEASLFTEDIFRMYEKFSGMKGWKFSILECVPGVVGGFREGSASIVGKDVFGTLKYESGVHRVQRIPATETNGRIHTSAMSVAILPESPTIQCKISANDIRVDVYRSGGNGGQSVNTTDSAVRMVHIPTGITVCMQDERSQHKNRAKALKVLTSRVYAQQKEAALQAERTLRNSQMGSGNRNERIRTYNYPQGRITEHRIKVSKFGIESMLNGNLLAEFIDDLQFADRIEKLNDLIDKIASVQKA